MSPDNHLKTIREALEESATRLSRSYLCDQALSFSLPAIEKLFNDNHINNLEVRTMNILGDYITAVQSATDRNDHTGAIVLMAQYTAKKHNRLEGVHKLVKSAQAVETLHDFYGYMPYYLNKIRNEVAARCESFMTDGEVKAFQEVR